MTRAQSEVLLLKRGNHGQYVYEDGAFLIRSSETSPGDFSLSVKWIDGVQHFRVLRDPAGNYFLWVVKFSSLNALIEHHRTASVSRSQVIYLKDLTDSQQAPKKQPAVRAERVRALYDFQAQDSEELALRKDDIVEVTDKSDENWWAGRIGSRQGLFPATYVQPC